MKKVIMILLFAAALAAAPEMALCQEQPAAEKLVLNNGARWKADQATIMNVGRLKNIVKRANGKTARSLKDHLATAKALQEGVARMIKECRLKGPDHLALHHWLEPLMTKINQLGTAAGAATAERSFNGIRAQLDLFDRYFQ
ncbi:MAG: hypothetical protein V4553_14960 [Bacteroidota bacterium]